MISPLLWQSLPFSDETSWNDFLGQHQLAHQALAAKTGTRLHTMDDLRDELGPHAMLHTDLAAALGLAATELSDADLHDEAAFFGWVQIHALDHARLHVAAGVP